MKAEQRTESSAELEWWRNGFDTSYRLRVTG